MLVELRDKNLGPLIQANCESQGCDIAENSQEHTQIDTGNDITISQSQSDIDSVTLQNHATGDDTTNHSRGRPRIKMVAGASNRSSSLPLTLPRQVKGTMEAYLARNRKRKASSELSTKKNKQNKENLPAAKNNQPNKQDSHVAAESVLKDNVEDDKQNPETVSRNSAKSLKTNNSTELNQCNIT